MKIVADTKVPFLKGVFEPYAEVVYKDGRDICREDVMDADAMIIRTRTRCDEQLLGGSSVQIIASATIGTDHIDLPWCTAAGIKTTNAAGCNASGVMDYVFSALYAVAARKGIELEGKTFGIVGVGNVGKKVEESARKLGFEVLLCDPPRAAAEGREKFCSLSYLLMKSDIVTLHTPLNGETAGMADEIFFREIKPGAIFINAARGEIVNEGELLHALPKLGATIIDTWCHEPDINRTLLDAVDIATPHIAGYSYQGKQNGTAAAVRAVARHFGIEPLYDFYPKAETEDLEPVRLHIGGLGQGEVAAMIQYNYPIFTDDFFFRLDPDGFERIRSEYRYRREFYLDL